MEKYIKDAFDKVDVSAERMKDNVRGALAEGASPEANASKRRSKPRAFRRAAAVAIAAVITLTVGTTAFGIDIGLNAPLLKLLNIDNPDEEQLAGDISILVDKSVSSENIDINVHSVVGNEYLTYITFSADLSSLPEYTEKGHKELFYNFSAWLTSDDDEFAKYVDGNVPMTSRTYQIESDGDDGRAWFVLEGRSQANLQGKDVTLNIGEVAAMTKADYEGAEAGEMKEEFVFYGDWAVDFKFDYKKESLDLGGGKAKAALPETYEVSTNDLIISDVLLSPLSLCFKVAGDGKSLDVTAPEGDPDIMAYVWKYLPVTATMKDGGKMDLWAEFDTEHKGLFDITEALDPRIFMTVYNTATGEVNSQECHEIAVMIKFRDLIDTSGIESIEIGGLTLPVASTR
jgi:hypothetical protein